MKLLLVILAVLFVSGQGKETGVRRYDGYKVYSVTATSPAQYQILWDLYTGSEGGLDFWTQPILNGKTDVMVPPEMEQEFFTMIQGMSFTVKIDDVQSLINEEKIANEEAKLRSGSKKLGWTAYGRFSEIEEFVNELPTLNSIASVETYGQSYEGRNLYAVKISTSPNNTKAIFVDANIHAREWITSATATYIMNELVSKPDSYRNLLDGVDYYFVPMVNVDGYEYAHTNDRMWRKTRSVNTGSTCRGCDPNRNFAFKFGGEGTSANPCVDTFKGPAAFSEKETKALADYIEGLQKNVNILAYLSFHSYGQLWLLPWGYTAGAYPPDYADQLSLGRAATAALKAVHGTAYTTGTGADVLYGVGGASDDWAKSIGIKYTVTIEMRDTGRNGFVLPAAQIIPNAEEVIASIGEVAKRVRSE